jgi:hypothetical protein
MEGGYTWEFKQYSQLGDKGFFGTFDIDNSSTGGNFASMNGWLGNEITGTALSTGSDVAGATIWAWISPEIAVNKAVKINGDYYIGAWLQNPNTGNAEGAFNAPEYFNSTIPGTQSSFSPGYWNNLWLTAQMPFGTVVVGKRPFRFGTALFWDGSDNTTVESCAIVAPYGPFKFGFIAYPWRAANAIYPALVDRNSMRNPHVGALLTYAAGNVSMGTYAEWIRGHMGPESQLTNATRNAFIPQDFVTTEGAIFFKYNTGRFFFNAETGWVDSMTRRQRNVNNTAPGADGASVFRPTYIQHWRHMAEMGSVVGPSKLSLMWSYIPGPDRRHGVQIDRDRWVDYPGFSNFTLFRPYSILMAQNYGAGNNSFTAVNGIGSDNGYMRDAITYAARLDFAVAANLNLYGSFF